MPRWSGHLLAEPGLPSAWTHRARASSGSKNTTPYVGSFQDSGAELRGAAGSLASSLGQRTRALVPMTRTPVSCARAQGGVCPAFMVVTQSESGEGRRWPQGLRGVKGKKGFFSPKSPRGIDNRRPPASTGRRYFPNENRDTFLWQSALCSDKQGSRVQSVITAWHERDTRNGNLQPRSGFACEADTCLISRLVGAPLACAVCGGRAGLVSPTPGASGPSRAWGGWVARRVMPQATSPASSPFLRGTPDTGVNPPPSEPQCLSHRGLCPLPGSEAQGWAPGPPLRLPPPRRPPSGSWFLRRC